MYNITKTLAGSFGNSEVPMKAVYGNAIIGVAEQTQICKPHFETIPNKEAPNNLSGIPVSVEDMVNNTDPASAVEVKTAVSYMKSGKALGTDGVSADMVKGGGEIVVRTLPEIFEGIWEAEEIPGDWKMGLIVILPKKETIICVTIGEGPLFSLSLATFSEGYS